MTKKEKNSEVRLIKRESIKCFVKRSFLAAPIVIGLSLFSLTCQKSAQSEATSNRAMSVNTSVAATNNAASQPPVAPQTNLKIGDQAPDFALTDTAGQPVKLSDFRGRKNVVLAFYVLAFTGG